MYALENSKRHVYQDNIKKKDSKIQRTLLTKLYGYFLITPRIKKKKKKKHTCLRR